MAARPSIAPGILGRHKSIAVGVGRVGVDLVGQDVVHDRGRPGMPSRAPEVRIGVQVLEDLADRHLLVREPAMDHAHQLGLGLAGDEMA